MSATWKQILCEETLRCFHLKFLHTRFLPALSTQFWTSGKGHSFLQKNNTWQGMAKSKQSYVFKKNTRNELTPNTLSDCLFVCWYRISHRPWIEKRIKSVKVYLLSAAHWLLRRWISHGRVGLSFVAQVRLVVNQPGIENRMNWVNSWLSAFTT